MRPRATRNPPTHIPMDSKLHFTWCHRWIACPMNSEIVSTLLELADATSHNLEFSHRPGVLVSYGEETITETNLLEIRRRHPNRIQLEVFTKHQEALNGADWEWHLVGRRMTLKMRVQAKRLQRNDVLRIRHRVGSTPNQQRDLLINQALADGMKPVYCIYCTEPQRTLWKQDYPATGLNPYQSGCLIADAFDVPLTTRHLSEIERYCVPWHFLFYRSNYARLERLYATAGDDSQVHFMRADRELRAVPTPPGDPRADFDARWNHPTVRDLNEEPDRDFDRTGVNPTTDEDRSRARTVVTAEREQIRRADRDRLLERRIRRILTFDVDGD